LKKKTVVLFIFLLFELYCLFDIFFHLSMIPTPFIQYSAIVFCVVFALWIDRHDIETRWIRIGLLFTLAADTLLVLIGSFQTLATLIFIFVQLSYAFRVHQNQSISLKFNLLIRFVIILASELFIFWLIKSAFDFLVFLSVFYIVNLFINGIFASIKNYNWLFMLGLWLLLACDILIGLSNAGPYWTFNPQSLIYRMLHWPFNLAWAFYIPSQVLLTLSIYFSFKPTSKQRHFNIHPSKMIIFEKEGTS